MELLSSFFSQSCGSNNRISNIVLKYWSLVSRVDQSPFSVLVCDEQTAAEKPRCLWGRMAWDILTALLCHLIWSGIEMVFTANLGCRHLTATAIQVGSRTSPSCWLLAKDYSNLRNLVYVVLAWCLPCVSDCHGGLRSSLFQWSNF